MADQTIGELQAVAVGDLPRAPDIYDDTLIPVEQGGEARHITGEQWKNYGISAAKDVADKALEASIHQPIIQNGTWWTWDIENDVYVDTGSVATGQKGDRGTAFVPSVDEAGNLSWTNDGGLNNPSPVNIQGPKGDAFTYEDFTQEQIAALTGPAGVSPTVSVESIEGGHRINIADNNGTKTFDLMDGADGSSIQSIVRTSGTGAAGSVDTYTITLTNGDQTTFQVYNGKDGTGSGDMSKSVYDPQNRNTDIFRYVDDRLGDINTILDSVNGEVV